MRPADHFFREIQLLARESGRGTQELLEVYVHERFLARLARSGYRDRFVLKGGLLLTVLGVRRHTRDADLLALGISNEPWALEQVVAEIASIDDDDGIIFDRSGISSKAIREEGEYEGLRIKMPAAISSAKLRVQLDISVGDPVEPRQVDYVELLGGEFTLLGYPIEQVLAEKIATMVERGDTNTRDRDWADCLSARWASPSISPATRRGPRCNGSASWSRAAAARRHIAESGGEPARALDGVSQAHGA